MNTALILAGGKGTRMGASVPKQYILHNGKPILIHTLEAFAGHDGIDDIYIVCPRDSIDLTREMTVKYNVSKIAGILPGGATRRESSLAGIRAISEDHGRGDIVLIHDAARPNVSARIISENISAAGRYGACETAVAVCDTIAVSEDGLRIKNIPDRRCLYNVQTPQSFRLGVIYDAHTALDDKLTESPDAAKDVTDDAALILRNGGDVFIVEGDKLNIKITTEEDLRILYNIMI